MIDKSWFERKKTGMPTEREEDGRRRKKGIDIHSGGRKRNGISLLFLQAPLMEFQDVADTLANRDLPTTLRLKLGRVPHRRLRSLLVYRPYCNSQSGAKIGSAIN
jgi:hypothetical protein